MTDESGKMGRGIRQLMNSPTAFPLASKFVYASVALER
jgi:hypothetical protein